MADTRWDLLGDVDRVGFISGRGHLYGFPFGLPAGATSNATTGVPVNGVPGWMPSALWYNPKGAIGSLLYLNVGTNLSSNWLNLDSILLSALARANSVTALNAVGAGTLTGAMIVSGVTARGGTQSATPFTDTTDTAANIVTALGNSALVGQSWYWTYENNTDAQATLAAGSGVTLSGMTSVPKNTATVYLVSYTGAGAVTITGIEMNPTVQLPDSKVVTGTAATLNAGDASGARVVHYINNASNATVTLRTATQMFGDIPNCQVGYSYTLLMRNLNATGLTLTAPDGNTTLSGTMTIAQNTTRTFHVIFNSATTMTITSMGIGAAAA